MSMRTIAASSPKSASASVRASSVLPTPVGPRKRKLPIGRLGSESPALARLIASATASTASLLLPDDALVELLLQPEQTLALLFGELADRYPGRPGDDFGNVLGRYFGDGLPSSLEGSQPVLQLLDPALEVLGLLKIFGGDGLILLALETPYVVLERPGVLRLGLGAQPDAG